MVYLSVFEINMHKYAGIILGTEPKIKEITMRLMVFLGLLACGGDDATQTTQEAATAPAANATTPDQVTTVKKTEEKATKEKASSTTELEPTNAENTTNNNATTNVEETK